MGGTWFYTQNICDVSHVGDYVRIRFLEEQVYVKMIYDQVILKLDCILMGLHVENIKIHNLVLIHYKKIINMNVWDNYDTPNAAGAWYPTEDDSDEYGSFVGAYSMGFFACIAIELLQLI